MPLFDKMPQKICVDTAAIDIIDFRNRQKQNIHPTHSTQPV